MAEYEIKRGDSYYKEFEIIDENDDPIPITDYTFTLTVNREKDPVAAQDPPLFSVEGVITDAANGRVAFRPTSSQTDVSPDTYWYDIEWRDTSGNIRTILKDKFIVTQDITK